MSAASYDFCTNLIRQLLFFPRLISRRNNFLDGRRPAANDQKHTYSCIGGASIAAYGRVHAGGRSRMHTKSSVMIDDDEDNDDDHDDDDGDR